MTRRKQGRSHRAQIFPKEKGGGGSLAQGGEGRGGCQVTGRRSHVMSIIMWNIRVRFRNPALLIRQRYIGSVPGTDLLS
jgi:hypothetical protein